MKPIIIYPIYFQVVEKEGRVWYFTQGEIIYNRTGKSIPQSKESIYGLTKQKIMIELFRINCGRDGYYLANLRDKKYYYCGLEFEDINTKLKELGIGRDDPVDYSSLPD